MATVPHTIEQPPAGNNFPEGTRVVTWGPLTTTNPDGAPYIAPHRSDKSVHVTGTFGAAAIVTIEGSNRADGGTADFVALRDPASGSLTFLTANGNALKQVLENTWQIRPNLTGGDGTSSLTVRMLITTTARR